VLNSTHPSDSGTYLVVASGPTGVLTNSVTLLTVDSAPPLITLNGNSTVLIPLAGAYVELGATAYDTCPGTSLPVTTNGTVNTAVLGEYDITYSATTGAGVPGSVMRTVNVINPVAGDTPLLAEFMGADTPEMRAKFVATIPLGRFSKPLDIANACLYLASDEAEFVTGACIEVDGGRCV